MKTKYILGAAMLIVAMVFTGCNNKNQKQENETTETTEMQEVHRLLIIVDPQVDFTTGSLAVAGGPEAMERLADAFRNGLADSYSRIIVTQDFHPENHCSFVEQGGVFPAHCVQGTEGMNVYPELQGVLDSIQGKDIEYLRKGDIADVEEFSILKKETHVDYFKSLIEKEAYEGIDICGIASDYCVLETMKDLINIFPAEKIRVAMNCVAAVADNDILPATMEENGVEAIEF